jgi:Tfp pilus assembly protein FimT
MIAVAIIGILAAITAPNFSRLSASLRMNAAARDISSTLQLARIKAIAQNTSVRIDFDSGAHTYQLEVRDPATLVWNAIKNGDCSHPMKDPVTQLYTLCALPQGVTFEDVTGNPITFQPGRGSTLPGNNGTIKLQNIQGKKTDVVVAQTGRVTVLKH